MPFSVIVTLPPYAPYAAEVARHPMVSGLRLNTVMPLRDGPAEALERLAGLNQPLWVDLKSRQLRVVGAAMPPFTEVFLSHRIRLQTPASAFFSDGREHATVVAVEGNRLILQDSPRRLIGPGESVNIPHPSLQIEGILTETDLAYLHAMQARGLNRVMLSFTETPADVQAVRQILPSAELILKIESVRGLAFARQYKNSMGRLMAARGDLYVEVPRPHHILQAMQTILQADPHAIAASRILDSLAYAPTPESADLSDLAYLHQTGYRTLMLGDQVCLRRESLLEALNLLQEISPSLP